jgi:hypothetical protein
MWYCILVAGPVGHADNHHKTQQKVLQRTKSVHWYQLVANISSPNVVSLDCILTSESLPKSKTFPFIYCQQASLLHYLRVSQRNSVEPMDNKFHAQCLWDNKNSKHQFVTCILFINQEICNWNSKSHMMLVLWRSKWSSLTTKCQKIWFGNAQFK